MEGGGEGAQGSILVVSANGTFLLERHNYHKTSAELLVRIYFQEGLLGRYPTPHESPCHFQYNPATVATAKLTLEPGPLIFRAFPIPELRRSVFETGNRDSDITVITFDHPGCVLHFYFPAFHLAHDCRFPEPETSCSTHRLSSQVQTPQSRLQIHWQFRVRKIAPQKVLMSQVSRLLMYHRAFLERCTLSRLEALHIALL